MTFGGGCEVRLNIHLLVCDVPKPPVAGELLGCTATPGIGIHLGAFREPKGDSYEQEV